MINAGSLVVVVCAVKVRGRWTSNRNYQKGRKKPYGNGNLKDSLGEYFRISKSKGNCKTGRYASRFERFLNTKVVLRKTSLQKHHATWDELFEILDWEK